MHHITSDSSEQLWPKLGLIQMVQHICQSGGLPHDDPNEHISSFLEICDTQRINGILAEVIKLKLFFFLWRIKQRLGLTHYDLTIFTQFEYESIYEAWERYKNLIRKVLHHGLPAWLEIPFFYNGLTLNTKMVIDAVAGGALMGKERDEAYELLEEMASNSYQWQSDRATPKKIAGVYVLDAISAIHAQLALLTKKFVANNVNAIQTENSSYDSYIQDNLAMTDNWQLCVPFKRTSQLCEQLPKE